MGGRSLKMLQGESLEDLGSQKGIERCLMACYDGYNRGHVLVKRYLTISRDGYSRGWELYQEH